MPTQRTRPAYWLVAGLSAGLLILSGCGGVEAARPAAPNQASAPPGGMQTEPAVAPSSATASPDPGSEDKPQPAAKPKAPTKPVAKPKADAKPKAAADPGPVTILSRGARSEKVRELQHRLSQLDWYAGVITGTYGPSTEAGVRGFQDKRGFRPTGVLDATTWNKLTAMTRRPTADQMHNKLRAGPAILKRGSTGDRVRALQARLKQIGWFAGSVTPTYGPATVSAVRSFQAKRAIPVTGEVDQRSWSRLTTMTRTPTDAELHNKAAKAKKTTVSKASVSGLDKRCLTGRAMCISKTSNSLVWVVNGKPQLRVDVRFGSYRTPTREGSFSVGWKSRHHVSTLYDSPMPYAMFFSGGQAVHYSSDFAARGYAGASHGCVNVRNLSGIQTLFSQVRVGDKVIVYR